MAMMIPTGPLPVNYPFYQQGQNSPPPNAYNPPQQQSRGNSLMDLFKQYNPVSWGVRQGERLGESGFGDALGQFMEPALSWYKQNTQKYMDEKGINAFGLPRSQDAMTPPPMIDDGQGMVPTPDQGATPEGMPRTGFKTYPPWMTLEDIAENDRKWQENQIQNEANGIDVRGGTPHYTDEQMQAYLRTQEGVIGPPAPPPGMPEMIDGLPWHVKYAHLMRPSEQDGSAGLFASTSEQIGNIPIDQFMRGNEVPPLLNANMEGLPALGQQYQSGEITTPGLFEGTAGRLGSALDVEGGYSRDALANAIPDQIGTQYAPTTISDEPFNIGLQSQAWDRPGVNPRTVQGMHDEIGQAFPDFNQEEQLIATRIVNSSRHDTYDMTDRQKRKYIQDLHPTDKAILAEYGRWISGEGSPPSGGSGGMPAGGSGVMDPTNTPPPLLPPNTI